MTVSVLSHFIVMQWVGLWETVIVEFLGHITCLTKDSQLPKLCCHFLPPRILPLFANNQNIIIQITYLTSELF